MQAECKIKPFDRQEDCSKVVSLCASPWQVACARLGRNLYVRFLVALFFLAMHLVGMTVVGKSRLSLPFHRGQEPAPALHSLSEPMLDSSTPAHWDRLLPSRWDAQHYIDIALRGFTQCPAQDLRNVPLNPLLVRCGFNFYPGYPVLAAALRILVPIPVDYVLFGLSLLASFVFLFLWTGPLFVDVFGVRVTYVSLLVLNAFTTGFTLVTLQTEPMALVLSLGAIVLLRKKRPLLGACLAGAATAMRISAVATGFAYALALTVYVCRASSMSRTRRALTLALGLPLCGWGLLTICGYFAIKYHDPFLYMHAHQQAYGHGSSLGTIFHNVSTFVLQSLQSPLREGVVMGLCFLWLAAGYQNTMRRFAPLEQVYWAALTALTLAVSLYGSSELGFAGMNRYWLLVLPLFLVIGNLTSRNLTLLVAWLIMSLWHYVNADLYIYLKQWS